MPKADKNPKAKQLPSKESAYTLYPWSCNHHSAYSEIVAYIPIIGDFAIIGDIPDAKGVDAEVVAGFITRAVNGYEKNRDMISQMAAALELCLGCGDGLT